jgi:hypothetical protein
MRTQEQAARVWPVLAFAAQEQKFVTYERLAGVTGIPRFALGRCLGHIHDYCDQHGLPHLNALVIGRLGKPGPGMPTKMSIAETLKEHIHVFAVDWAKHQKPKASDFR